MRLRDPLRAHPPKSAKKKPTPEKVVNLPEDGHKHIARARILVNHKPLKKDDVLRVFDKEVQRGDKRPASGAVGISLAKVMRKRWARGAVCPVHTAVRPSFAINHDVLRVSFAHPPVDQYYFAAHILRKKACFTSVLPLQYLLSTI